MSYLLGIEVQMHEDEDEDMKSTLKIEVDHHEHSKKTKKRARQVKKQMEHIAKEQRTKESKLADSTPLFPAIMLLHNPQELAEHLYTKLRQSGERFEIKLLIMNFISRLIGCHKLILLSFYSFIQKYLTSHQIEVTKILAYLIQGCHDLVPPEEVVPVLKTIAYNFITERCTNEVVAVGINTVREILTRVPAILLETDMADFIQDLAQYGHKTHKSVMVAAHSVVNFVR
jgi:protein SDA1